MRSSAKKNRKKAKKTSDPKSTQRGPRYWIAMSAMGTLVAYSAVGSRTIATVEARSLRPAVSARFLHSQADETRRFDIPPGPLEEVLAAFEQVTGVRVQFENDAIRGLSSPGISGIHAIEQALKQLLSGTGIGYRFTDRRSAVLEVRGPSASVEVTAGLPSVIASPKFTEPLRETPQSITVVPRQVIESQGVTTLRDSLRNVAGISLAAGEGGAQGDNLTIRGFTARNDIFLDGMRDFGSYYRDPFNIEQVEVLRGPSSVTFGRGTTGGVVNQASKAPQLGKFVAGTIDFGSDLTRRVTLDINQPLSQLGKGAAFRLNIMAHDADVAGRDIAENRRFGIAPSLALGLSTATRLTLSYYHQTADDIPDYGIPWLFNAPAPVDRENYYGFKDANFLKTRANIGTLRLEHDFGSRITLRNQLRYARYGRDVQVTSPRIPATVTPDTPLASINVTRNQVAANSVETFFDDQTDMTARFKTGSIRHTLVAGLEFGRETSSPRRLAFANVPGTSLLNPNTEQPFSGTATITSQVQATARSFGAYVIDTVELGEKWDLIGGVRWDWFDTDFKQSVGAGASFSRIDRMASYRTAIVYKPVAVAGIYFAYGNSFNPSAESLSLSAGNANLPPEENRTFELGSKWDLFSSRLSLRGALFRTEKLNAREADPTNALLNLLAGNQRVQGFEVEATGRLTNRWQLLSGYAFMDSELVKSRFFPAAVGSRLANVPKNTFNFWNSYEFENRLTVGGGGQFVDSRTASTTAPFDPVTGLVKQLPGYWVFNAMASYPVAERFSLQLNLYNLTNNYYFDQIHPGHIVPGSGFAALAGFKFRF